MALIEGKRPQVGEHRRQDRVRGAKVALLDRDGFSVVRFGVRIAALLDRQHRQIVQSGGHRPVRFTPDGQSATVVALREIELALLSVHSAEIVQRQREAAVAGAE